MLSQSASFTRVIPTPRAGRKHDPPAFFYRLSLFGAGMMESDKCRAHSGRGREGTEDRPDSRSRSVRQQDVASTGWQGLRTS